MDPVSSTFFEFLRRPPRSTPLPPSGRRTRWRLLFLVLSVEVAVWVVVLQILGVNGLMWTTLGLSQKVLSMSLVSRLIERDPPILFVSKIIWFCHSICENLGLQERPMWDKRLHLNHVRAWICENQDLARNDRKSLWTSSFCVSFFKLWARWYSFFSEVFTYLWQWSRPFLITFSGIERKSSVYPMTPRLATVSFKRCPHVQ